MKRNLLLSVFILFAPAREASAQQTTIKPPVGVPADATQFNGKWYRVYLEKAIWPVARDRCKTLGGQLAVVPDEATHNFLKELKSEAGLWLGATDEKVEGVWKWVNGTEMVYKAWLPREPDGGRSENYLMLIRGGWADHGTGRPIVVGFICEWKK